MPLFIIVSGFFYKDKSIKEEMKHMLFHLVLPTTIIIFLTECIVNISNMGFVDSIIISLKAVLVCLSYQSKIIYDIPGTGVLWFIYFLVVMKLLFIFTIKISNENDKLLFLIILIESFAGSIIGLKGYWLPWSIDVSFACIIFYYFGYVLKKYDVFDRIISNYLVMIILLVLWIIGIKYCCIEIAVRFYPYWICSFITAISGSLIIFKLSFWMEKNMKKISKAIAWCGKYSFYILIIHYLEIAFINYNFYVYNSAVTILLMILIKCFISIICTFLITLIIDLAKKIF